MVIKDNTPALKKAMKEGCREALEAIAVQMEGHAKELCPVDTGRLRNSIAAETDGHEVIVGSNVEYAPAVELIDRPHQTGQAHFLRDSIQNNLKEYEQIAAQIIKR